MGIGGGGKLSVIIEAKTRQFIQGMTNARRAVLDFVAAIGAIGTAVAAMARYFAIGAQFERQQAALEGLAQAAGTSGQAMVDAIRAASNETISRMDAMRAANQALMLGVVDNAKEMQELTEIAVTLGRAMGRDATQSIQDMTVGVGRQSKLILDNLGIVFSAEQAYKEYADSVGKTVGELTDAERKQAFLNKTLEIGRQRMEEIGPATDDAAAAMERMTASVKNAEAAFGTFIAQGLMPYVDILNSLPSLIGGAEAAQIKLVNVFAAGQAHLIANYEATNELINALLSGVGPIKALEAGFAVYNQSLMENMKWLGAVEEVTREEAAATEGLAEAHDRAWQAAERQAGGERKLAEALEKQGEIGFDVFRRMEDLQRQAEEARQELTGGIAGRHGAVTVGMEAEDKLEEIRQKKRELIFEIITEGLSLKDTMIVAAAMGLLDIDAEMQAAIQEAAEINARLRAGTLPGGAAAAGGAGAQLARGHTGLVPPGLAAGAPTTGLGSDLGGAVAGAQRVMLTIGFDQETLKAGVQKVVADDHITVAEMADERTQGGRTSLLGGR